MTKQTTPTIKTSSMYTSFYLVMLILTTIGVAFNMWGIFEVFNLIIHFSAAPVYAGLMLFSLALLPVQIVALILLYQKHKLGLILLFSSLGISFIIAIILLFFSNQMMDYTIATTPLEDIDQGGGREFFTQFMTVFWYVALVAGNLVSIAGATLWYFAWRNQQIADKK